MDGQQQMRLAPDGTAEQQFALMLHDRIIQAEKRIVAIERVQPVPPATRMAAIGSARYFRFSFWAFQDSFDPNKNPFYSVQGHLTTTMNFCTHLLQDTRGELIEEFLKAVKDGPQQWTRHPRRSSASSVQLPDINQAFLRQVLVVEGVISTEENQCDAAYLAAVLENTWGDCWTGDHGECAHQCLDLEALGITHLDLSRAISGEGFDEYIVSIMLSRPYVKEINEGPAWEQIFKALSIGGQHGCWWSACEGLSGRLTSTQHDSELDKLQRLALKSPMPTSCTFEHPVIVDFMEISQGVYLEMEDRANLDTRPQCR